jgi:hypothetical protein
MRCALVVVVVAAVAALPGCGTSSGPQEGLPTVTVRFSEGAEAAAEVATTKDQIETGLMFRETLGADDGMLFLFTFSLSDGFYMKNTVIPLSIAYMRRVDAARYEVVGILDMEPCPKGTKACPTYPPGASYEAALEMNQGWFDDHDVEVGAEMTVDGVLPAPFGGTPAASAAPDS